MIPMLMPRLQFQETSWPGGFIYAVHARASGHHVCDLRRIVRPALHADLNPIPSLPVVSDVLIGAQLISMLGMSLLHVAPRAYVGRDTERMGWRSKARGV